MVKPWIVIDIIRRDRVRGGGVGIAGGIRLNDDAIDAVGGGFVLNAVAVTVKPYIIANRTGRGDLQTHVPVAINLAPSQGSDRRGIGGRVHGRIQRGITSGILFRHPIADRRIKQYIKIAGDQIAELVIAGIAAAIAGGDGGIDLYAVRLVQIHPYTVQTRLGGVLETVAITVQPYKAAVNRRSGRLDCHTDLIRFGGQQGDRVVGTGGDIAKGIPSYRTVGWRTKGRSHRPRQLQHVQRIHHNGAKIKLQCLHRGNVGRGVGSPIWTGATGRRVAQLGPAGVGLVAVIDDHTCRSHHGRGQIGSPRTHAVLWVQYPGVADVGQNINDLGVGHRHIANIADLQGIQQAAPGHRRPVGGILAIIGIQLALDQHDRLHGRRNADGDGRTRRFGCA